MDYFKSFVLHNYMYKGIEVWQGAKKELKEGRGVSKTCHPALDAGSPEKRTLNIRGLRVKPAMTDSSKTTFDTASLQTSKISTLPETILFENSGYSVNAFLYALSHKDIHVVAIEEDEEKVALARACAGLPENITIYHTSEWKNT